MILHDCELHNIVELDAGAGHPGPLIRRIPRTVAEHLINGALSAEDAALCELRFVVESGRRLALCLTSVSGGDLFIYRGDLVHNHIRLTAGQAFRHVLDFEVDPFANLQPGAFEGHAFSPRVWRVVFDGPTLLHGVDRMGCVIRPPLPGEKPGRRWLAYGSSITQGYTPVTRQQCYVAQTARLLGVDVLNLGLSGACFIEPEFAAWLGSRTDWDLITCELGVNLRTTVDPDEFERRARHLAQTVTAARPGTPVVLISPFTTGNDWLTAPDLAARNTRGYETALRRIANEFRGASVHLLDGRELLPGVAGLTCDLVHPSTEGHSTLAARLARSLAPLLP